MTTWVTVEIILFGHAWECTARVDLSADGSAFITFDEAFGKKDGRLMWWRDCDFRDRVPRVELERVEMLVIRAAREQLNAAAIRQRMQEG